MSTSVWARYVLLSQLDFLALLAFFLVAFFVGAASWTYLRQAATPPTIRVVTWVPLPGDLPAGPVPAYGAPALKALYRRFFSRSFGASALIHAALIGGGVLAAALLAPEPEILSTRERKITVDIISNPLPPRLQADAPEARGLALDPTAPPPAPKAIPVPVPDAQALPTATILSQDELYGTDPGAAGSDGGSIWGGGGGGDSGGLFAPPLPESDTASRWTQPVERLPELVTIPEPAYPPLAREAQIQGVVQLMVLVGPDGRVRTVKVMQSIPALDDAALAAMRRAVFRPALCQQQPVAVWITQGIRFSLRDE